MEEVQRSTLRISRVSLDFLWLFYEVHMDLNNPHPATCTEDSVFPTVSYGSSSRPSPDLDHHSILYPSHFHLAPNNREQWYGQLSEMTPGEPG